MTDFLYPDILNEQLTYARQARAAWLWTNVAERSRIFLQVLDTLQPICASLARDSVQETGYGIFEDRMLMITRLLRDLRSCCLQTESPFSERLSCTDTHTQSQPSGTLLGIPSSIHPVTETLFAAAIAIQTGNPLIFFFSDSAFQISARTASLVRDAAIAAGAPDNCIQWLEIADDNLLEKCNHCPDISGLILSGLSANIRKVFSAFSADCWPSVTVRLCSRSTPCCRSLSMAASMIRRASSWLCSHASRKQTTAKPSLLWRVIS